MSLFFHPEGLTTCMTAVSSMMRLLLGQKFILHSAKGRLDRVQAQGVPCRRPELIAALYPIVTVDFRFLSFSSSSTITAKAAISPRVILSISPSETSSSNFARTKSRCSLTEKWFGTHEPGSQGGPAARKSAPQTHEKSWVAPESGLWSPAPAALFGGCRTWLGAALGSALPRALARVPPVGCCAASSCSGAGGSSSLFLRCFFLWLRFWSRPSPAKPTPIGGLEGSLKLAPSRLA